MMAAIVAASQDVWSYKEKTPRHAGLYAIRDFERLNGVAFDPFNRAHVEVIAGMGRWARFFTLMKRQRFLRNAAPSPQDQINALEAKLADLKRMTESVIAKATEGGKNQS